MASSSTSSPTGKHAGPGVASDRPPVAEPSYAEQARTLMHLCRTGSFSTLSRKLPGFPFGSVMPYSLDELGRPAFLISTMAMHTQNLLADPRASLLVTQPASGADPLGAGRVTLVGNVPRVPEPEVPEVRALYLARYENSRHWVDYEDFAFFRMDVVDVYYVGGFGVMGWVAAADYSSARPDPLADVAPGIIEHANRDHINALMLLAHASTGIEAKDAAMTSIDRLGFNVRLKTQDGPKGARIAFPREVTNAAEVRTVLTEMVTRARLA